MTCPICHHQESRVIRTKGQERRRECLQCRHRWTTVEVTKEQYERSKQAAEGVKALAERLG